MQQTGHDTERDPVLATLATHSARARAREEGRGRTRRRRGVVMGLLAVLLVALGLGLWQGFARSGGHAAATTTQARQPRSPKPATSSTSSLDAVTTLAVPPLPQAVQLTLAATRGSSWVEVRAGSSTGKVLYAGTLAAGASKQFESSARIWVRFGGAGNVDAVLDGKPLPIPAGTYDGVFDSLGFHPAGG